MLAFFESSPIGRTWALEKIEKKPKFLQKKIVGDKAHFFKGYVNKLYCPIWLEEQPEQIQELPFWNTSRQNNGLVHDASFATCFLN